MKLRLFAFALKLADGTVESSDPIPFSVVIYVPPESHTEGTSP